MTISKAYSFRLYIAGISTDNQVAILKFKKLFTGKFDGAFKFEVIDVLQEPERAMEDNILATPMLVKVSPSPAVKIILNSVEEENLAKEIDFFFKHWVIHDKKRRTDA